jgi:hypothetical protein
MTNVGEPSRLLVFVADWLGEQQDLTDYAGGAPAPDLRDRVYPLLDSFLPVVSRHNSLRGSELLVVTDSPFRI